MNIYKFTEDEGIWFAAEDQASALTAYKQYEKDNAFSDDELRSPVPENFIPLTYQERLDAYYDDGSGLLLFEEQLANLIADPDTKFPCLFASQDY